MVPRQPPRYPQLGFLLIPPFRVQGISIAGEETAVQIPEMDVCFDIGRCPRQVLTSNHIALTHGHMDHAAGIAYYFSQRHFQGMGAGTVVCHPKLAGPIHNVMKAWVELEGQVTPYNVVPLAPEQELMIKNNVYLRAFETVHSNGALGYCLIERRSKLRPELAELPQEKLLELKNRGEAITRTIEVPHIAFMGDTAWGAPFERPDVLAARILITECTFLEPGHRDRAAIGKHLHLDDIVRLLTVCQAEAVVLTHLSRRTNIAKARRWIDDAVRPEDRQRVLILMDGRTNRDRYEQQLARMQGEGAAQEAEGQEDNGQSVDPLAR